MEQRQNHDEMKQTQDRVGYRTPDHANIRGEALDRAWGIFAGSGRIGDYLFYKDMEASFRAGEDSFL